MLCRWGGGLVCVVGMYRIVGYMGANVLQGWWMVQGSCSGTGLVCYEGEVVVDWFGVV